MMTVLLLLAASQAIPAEPPEPTPTPEASIMLTRPATGPPPKGNSLAEVAKRIKLRLPANGPRVLTNESVKQLAEGVDLTMASARAGGTGSAAPVSGGSEDAKKAKWQQRYRAALQRVSTLESDVKALDAQASGLEREFYAHDDPVYRDSTIKPKWDKTLEALAKARSDLENARNQPDDVLNAARRDGALPGWFRGMEEGGGTAGSSRPPASSGQGSANNPAPKPSPTPAPALRPAGPT